MMEKIPLFEHRCAATFKRAAETFRVRGDHYGDTWRNSQHLALRAVMFALTGKLLPIAQLRALASAALVDIKYQRLEGGWDPDHLIDGINYQAYCADEMHEIYASAANVNNNVIPKRSEGPLKSSYG